MTARFNEAVGEIAPLLAKGRDERPEAERLPASTEDSTIGSLVSLVQRKVAAGEATQLSTCSPTAPSCPRPPRPRRGRLPRQFDMTSDIMMLRARFDV